MHMMVKDVSVDEDERMTDREATLLERGGDVAADETGLEQALLEGAAVGREAGDAAEVLELLLGLGRGQVLGHWEGENKG